MQLYRNTEQLPLFRNAVLTIGTFDGVHAGHRQVIAQMVSQARMVNGETVILTFDPHPRTIVKASDPIRLINTMDEKIELLAALGIDHLVIIPFTEAFAQLSAEDYISRFLIRYFQPHTLIIGYDHRFGKGRSGNYALLKEQSEIYQYQLLEIPAHLLHSNSVSSTRIREAIGESDIETANQLLGYTYFFSGIVTEGSHLGRTIGFPTANLFVEEKSKIIPGDGVYAIDIVISDEPEQHYKGMMNIGFRPTVDGKKKLVEVNIFQFDRMIYGNALRVFAKKFLRPEQKFSGLPALKAQLELDKQNALQF